MKKLTLVLSMMLALVGLNANAAIYIVGDGPLGGWACDGGNEMTANGDGTYTYVVTIAADATSSTVYFVFADNRAESGDWTTFNNNYRIGPTSGNVEVQVTGDAWTLTQKAGGDNGAYFFKGTKGESYTVTYDETNSQFKVEGYVEPVTEFTYTVAGSSADLFGTTWDATNTANDMTLVNGLYTFTKNDVELTTAGFSFKVVENHDWGTAYPSNNYVQAIGTHGYYNVVITFNKDTKEITCTPTLVEEITDEEDPIYTVAGAPAALFGTEWAPSLIENEMTKGQDGIYTWTKQNVALTAGNVEFKVVLGHDWGVEYPSSNYVATIDANGNYDVTITFNPENQEITFAATVVEETEDFYTVAGEPAGVFGVEWTPSHADNNMTLVDGLYTWTKENVELAAQTVIQFKVVKNNNWSTCWPADNYTYTVAEDGTYNLTITFNAETEEVLFNCVKAGDEPIEMVYTVVGPQAVFGTDWDATDTANDMVLNQETGLYTWTKENVELVAGFGFKVVGNHTWDNEWPQGYGNNWNVNIEEAGIYTIEITFNAETGEINCVATKTGDITPVHYDGDVYIMGEVNDNGGWFTNVGVLMDRDAENNVYTALITTAGENVPDGETAGYSYFSFTKQLAETADDWTGIEPYRFGAASDGDFWVTAETFNSEIALQNNGQAFRIPAGTWYLTLSVDNMTLVIKPVIGDVNNDTVVNITDVTSLISATLNENYGNINMINADINGDGVVNVTDVTLLISAAMAN